jgi:hypothetical protein
VGLALLAAGRGEVWRRGRGGIGRRVTHARTEGVTLCVGKGVKSNYRSYDLSLSHPVAIITA